MLPISGSLPASKTHANRRWSFIASTDCAQPGLGTLTLVQGKREVDSYSVDLVDNEVLFCRLDETSDVYGVTLNRIGNPVKCNCKGFSFTKKCKHVDATRELLADGIVCVRPALAA